MHAGVHDGTTGTASGFQMYGLWSRWMLTSSWIASSMGSFRSWVREKAKRHASLFGYHGSAWGGSNRSPDTCPSPPMQLNPMWDGQPLKVDKAPD